MHMRSKPPTSSDVIQCVGHNHLVLSEHKDPRILLLSCIRRPDIGAGFSVNQRAEQLQKPLSKI